MAQMPPKPYMARRTLQLGLSRSAAPIRTRANGFRRRYVKRSGLIADIETLHLDRGYDNEVVRGGVLGTASPMWS